MWYVAHNKSSLKENSNFIATVVLLDGQNYDFLLMHRNQEVRHLVAAAVCPTWRCISRGQNQRFSTCVRGEGDRSTFSIRFCHPPCRSKTFQNIKTRQRLHGRMQYDCHTLLGLDSTASKLEVPEDPTRPASDFCREYLKEGTKWTPARLMGR